MQRPLLVISTATFLPHKSVVTTKHRVLGIKAPVAIPKYQVAYLMRITMAFTY